MWLYELIFSIFTHIGHYRLFSSALCTIQWEKAMAPHSSILAWRTPGMGEPGGLPSGGSYRVGHDWSDLAAAAAAAVCMCQPQSPNLFPPAYSLVTRGHSTPGSSVLHCLPELAQVHCSIKSVMLTNDLILCCPLLLLPSVFPSIRVFSNKLDISIRLPKCWSFSFSYSPSNECLRLISFRTDWFDLLAVRGTLKSLL